MCSNTVVSYSSCFTPRYAITLCLLFSHPSCAHDIYRINYWKYFALFLSLYWTSAVLSNIVHCSTAGAVSSWWFDGTPRTATQASAIVKKSIIHASTVLMGPICLGSLLVAVIRATRSVVHIWLTAMKYKTGERESKLTKFVSSCLATSLEVLDQLVTYCNHYAFCYVSIYDMSFKQASR